MSTEKTVYRLEPNGPADTGLRKMKLDPADFQSDLPEQHLHVYFEDEALGLSVGVWTTTTMQEAFGPYPGDEFMWVLEGSVAIVHEDGHEDVFRAGDAFVIPKGLPCAWKQTESIRKYYTIFEDAKGGMPEKPVADRAIRLEPKGPAGVGLTKIDLPKTSNFEGEPPTQHDHSYFEDATERLFAGTWTCTPMRRKAQRFGRFEIMCLLEGGMTLTDDAGVEHKFHAPDVVSVLPDAVNAWIMARLARIQSKFSSAVQYFPGAVHQARCSKCVAPMRRTSAAASPSASRLARCHVTPGTASRTADETAWTSYPLACNCAMQCRPMNPLPPVTRTFIRISATPEPQRRTCPPTPG